MVLHRVFVSPGPAGIGIGAVTSLSNLLQCGDAVLDHPGLGIDHNDFNNFDIHIHFPSGAIPKDGPSAGVTVSLVIASVMAERPIRNDIAMTGEVTLRGRVLSVGGIKEKISAAYRAGIRTILIPSENKKDLKDLPSDIIKKTKFIFIKTRPEISNLPILFIEVSIREYISSYPVVFVMLTISPIFTS